MLKIPKGSNSPKELRVLLRVALEGRAIVIPMIIKKKKKN